ncbi:MAG: CHRD domain-containing protein [Armatimonadetes bacterium]|nr:CHRD domain-containing protein [Armatimonadota bacterium]
MAAFNLSGNLFSGDVVFNGLTSAFLAAHVRQGAPGVAGPVIFGLQVDPNNPFHLFGSGILACAQIAALKAGNLYVNIHSPNYAAGEIRGQFPAVPEPESLATLLTMGGLSAMGFLRRRKVCPLPNCRTI